MENKEKYDSTKNILRPRVNREEDLKRLADQLKSTPTALVNFCVDIGIEVMEKSRNEMIKYFEAKIREKLE